MMIEEVRDNPEGGDRNYDNFPVGMRVLAVDDDPICLKLLEGLLRKCQYHVTTTSQARVALKMLRENKDRFDLVISDVHMPDMDGFKLLELVGLEMDLPVIMLSANSDSKLVMKGVTHGACDYLVKPVRLEELRNIWQHVVRRKKVDSKQSKSASQDKALQGNGEVCQGPQQTGSADQSGKHNKKRKDEEDEGEDNGQEHEDPATQKKPRVVWSIELHRKFVAAVNQLGIEKAVPKRILDLMNVEGLTRENVASHLQKYRLYLKRISSVATQQANMVAALGGKDAAYMRMSTLDGYGDFRTLTGSGRLSSPAFSSYTQGGMLGRLNSPAGINLRNIASSTLVQPSQAQNLNNSVSNLGKLHPAVSPANQTASVFQGVSSSFELDHLQQNKCPTGAGDYHPMDDSRTFAASAFADTRSLAINSSNSLSGAPSNTMMLQGNTQQVVAGGGFVDQSSVSLASFPSESFNTDVGGSSKFLDDGSRTNENWQTAAPLPKFPSNALANECFSQGQSPLSNLRGNSSSAGPHLQNRPLGFSSTATTSASLDDSRGDIQGQQDLSGGNVQNLSQAPGQRWGVPKQNYSHNSNNMFSTLSPQDSSNGFINPLSQSMAHNGVTDRRMEMCLNGQSNVGTSAFLQHYENENPTTGARGRSSEEYMLDQIKPQGGFVNNSYDALDDLMSAIKREQNGSMFVGDIGFDAYQFGSCM